MPQALILAPSGAVIPDSLVCSGQLGGHGCPYAVDGRMPAPAPLCPDDPGYSVDQGNAGDLCPPCATQQLTSLAHWNGHGGVTYPADLAPCRLFKCCQSHWVVVPGLHHETPTRIVSPGERGSP